MPYNGSGSASSASGGSYPASGSTLIESSKFNTMVADQLTMFSTAICKDGQTTTTQRIPFAAGASMGSQTITAVAAGTATTHAATVGQLQSSAVTTLGTIAGTNTITAAGTPAVGAYAAGQTFRFIPANTNTGATTLNIDSLGAKNIYWNGAALSGGEIVQSSPVEVFYDGTQFQIMNPQKPRLTNSLSGDVALNNTGSYFTGPTVAQGTVGTWFASGSVTVIDTAGAAEVDAKLWDGTTVIASTRARIDNAGATVAIALSGYITSPAGNIRISVNDPTSTSGQILFNATGNSKDSTLSVIRIA